MAPGPGVQNSHRAPLHPNPATAGRRRRNNCGHFDSFSMRHPAAGFTLIELMVGRRRGHPGHAGTAQRAGAVCAPTGGRLAADQHGQGWGKRQVVATQSCRRQRRGGLPEADKLVGNYVASVTSKAVPHVRFGNQANGAINGRR
jgi:hypothetical protein